MKKFRHILVLILLVCINTGCTTNKNENVNKVNNASVSNSVVAYFSATNNTEKVAKLISEETGSDIVKIISKTEYTDEDLNYKNDNCRANIEQKDEKARPEIANNLQLDKYDTVYLGYPIWWGTAPRIILTLIDKYNLEGKKIIPFCTSGSSGIETSVNDMKNYNSKLTIIDGKRFNKDDTKENIKKWIDSLE